MDDELNSAMRKHQRLLHERDAREALVLALVDAGLTVQPNRMATMIERVATMLETLIGWRGMIARRTSIRAPRESVALANAVAAMVAEARSGGSELSGAHASPAIELPGHVNGPDCLGLGIVRHESLALWNVWVTCDCADPSALSSVERDAWQMPAWQAATLLDPDSVSQEDACAPTQRMPQSAAS